VSAGDVQMAGRAAGSGLPLDGAAGIVHDMRDREIVRDHRVFMSKAQALEAVGLEE